jgi:uncharacterized OB-fold protein
MQMIAACDVSGGTRGLASDYRQQLIAAGRPLVQTCIRCHGMQFPPLLRCPRCHEDTLAWVDGGDTGRISTFVTVFGQEQTPSYAVPSQLAERMPYTTLFVTLERYDGVRVAALLTEGQQLSASAAGSRVILSVTTTPRPVLLAALT